MQRTQTKFLLSTGKTTAAVLALALAVSACQTTVGERPIGQSPDALINAGNSANILAGNSGRLIGKVKGPIQFQVETHGNSLIAPGTSRFVVLQAADKLAVASGAKVEVTDVSGKAISYGPVTTDAEGSYSFRKLKASTATLILKATYTLAGKTLVLKGVAAAPRTKGTSESTLTPASTLIVKKALEMARVRPALGGQLTAGMLNKLTAAIGPELDDKAIVAAALLSDAEAALAFDALLDTKPGLRDKLRALVSRTPLVELIEKQPVATESAAPTPAPVVSESVAPLPAPVFPTRPVEKDGVFTMAGSGTAGYVDGAQQNAAFNVPFDVATDAFGNLFVADSENHAVRLVLPNGMVSTLAGNGVPGFADGKGKEARFKELSGVAADNKGNLFVADWGNHAIRKVTADGTVTTIAGDGTPGLADGVGKAARFNHPTDLTVDREGNVYVSDEENHAVRKVAPDGTVTTLVGGQGAGFADGDRTTAKIHGPSDVAVDVDGNLYVADTVNHSIRKLTPDGLLSTLAGNGQAGYADAKGAEARFDAPFGVVVDDLRRVYVADSNNHRVRLVAPDGTVSTFKGTGTTGYRTLAAEPGLFNLPSGAAIRRNARGQGEVYIADAYNHQIRKFVVTITNENDYLPK